MQDDDSWRNWFKGKELTTNWLGSEVRHWFSPLEHLVHQKCKVLEIGSYEGRSAIAFLEYLPNCHLKTVDIFIDREVEDRFDRNMKPYGNRVEKIKSRGIPVMEKLLGKEEFDVVYIDTGKSRDRTFANGSVAWPLLKIGGIMIWDDLAWGADRPSQDRPHDGIWQFCLAFADCLEYLHEGKQMIIKKTKDWPDMPKVEKISMLKR